MFRHIYGFGKSRRDILEEIDSSAYQLIEHLVKIILYRDRGNLDHWCKELYGFLPRIDKIKGKNKYPSKDMIINALERDKHTTVCNVLKRVKLDYEYVPYNVSINVIENFINLYFDWISEILSKEGELPGKIKCADKAKEILDEFE